MPWNTFYDFSEQRESDAEPDQPVLTDEEVELIAGAAPLQGLPPAREIDGDWCDTCHGYTHMPWCGDYVKKASRSSLSEFLSAPCCPRCVFADSQQGEPALKTPSGPLRDEFLAGRAKNSSHAPQTLKTGILETSQAPNFDSDWELAPRGMTNYVEREVAEYWYRMGGNAKKQEILALENGDLREAARLRELARKEIQ